jgi:glycerophosphoryl diester phosphodiesterase
LNDGARIPRLGEVLRLTRGRAVVQIEIKAGVPVAPVVRAVRRARASAWVVLASFDAGLVRQAARLAPDLPRMWITARGIAAPTLARRLAALGATGVSVDHRVVPAAAWVRGLQARGFAVWCWTVNTAPAARRLARWEVDALLSDNPALLRVALFPFAAGPRFPRTRAAS